MYRQNGGTHIMELNKDNYEFLMFELLEGNLNEAEKNALLEQINASSFYQREWTLMQHAVLEPNDELAILNKDALYRSSGRIYAFNWFNGFAKVAASLIFISAIGWFIYSNKQDSIRTTSIKPAIEQNTLTIKDTADFTKDVKQTPQTAKIEEPKNSFVRSNIEAERSTAITANSDALPVDSIIIPNIPERIQIQPKAIEKIVYSVNTDEVSCLPYTYSDNRTPQSQNKIVKLYGQANQYASLAKAYWNDIPNLKLKITPKLKERNIGIVLKGETIYASAIVEIK